MAMSGKKVVLVGCWSAVMVALGVGCSASDSANLSGDPSGASLCDADDDRGCATEGVETLRGSVAAGTRLKVVSSTRLRSEPVSGTDNVLRTLNVGEFVIVQSPTVSDGYYYVKAEKDGKLGYARGGALQRASTTSTLDAGAPPQGSADSGVPTADSGSTTPPPVTPGSYWKPSNAAPIHWHWQLSDDFVVPRDVRPNVTVYDIDGELTSAATVAALHALGPNVKVICYFDAGVYETYRSDKAKFPASVIGKEDVGWPGSYWLDVRQLDVIMPIMKARMQTWCKDKGFDAVEPDETEVWSNASGFPITKAQNNAFNQAIAAAAHELGLSVGLKGNNTEAGELEPYFDWALTEQCWEYSECDNFQKSFLAKGKAVFNVEYKATPNCATSNAWHMNATKRDLDVVGPANKSFLYQPCIPDTQNTW